MIISLLTSQAFNDIDREPSLRTQGAADEGERNGPEAVFIDIVNAVFSSPPSKISHLLTNTLVFVFRIIPTPAPNQRGGKAFRRGNISLLMPCTGPF